MKKYHGSCHCGRIQFVANTTIDKVVECNCSICEKKAVLHHRVSTQQFGLIKGKEYLSVYQFDTQEAKHYFCRVCGVHPFSNPRAAPNMYSINIRCLDDFDLHQAEYELIHFDGRNWEAAAENLNKKLAVSETD